MTEKLTPMMEQYFEIKKDYPDTLLFYRIGDFYEMFYEDAKIASRELDLILTGKSVGTPERAPMCGVPHHAVTPYIQRLVQRGYKVAIVEQTEDPKAAKGIVKRDVVRIITPGTMMDDTNNEKNSVYIASIEDCGYSYALAMAEMSTGENMIRDCAHNFTSLIQVLLRNNVREVVVRTGFEQKIILQLREMHIAVSYCDSADIKENYTALAYEVRKEQDRAAYGRLLAYLEETQRQLLEHLQPAVIEREDTVLYMDFSTQRNLELTESLHPQNNGETLWSFLDVCRSAMGSRRLKQWIVKPLVDRALIEQRYDRVQVLMKNFRTRQKLRDHLSRIYDVQRLIARCAMGTASAVDCQRLGKTLNEVPGILDCLSDPAFAEYAGTDRLQDLGDMLAKALNDELPAQFSSGNIFRDGYNAELDEARMIQRNGRQFIASLEAKERERTGIKTLKIGYNKVFGYYIEISKGALDQVKDEWGYIRKQTLVNNERFISQELKEKEDAILHAEENAARIERMLFAELLDTVRRQLVPLQRLAVVLAELDVYAALAEISAKYGYVRPEFTDDEMEIISGKHPILDVMMKDPRYIANDLKLNRENSILLITGPNMGGKSTYMRQTALIVIMAQMGCFVPAKRCRMPLIDKVFTRIGASDDILAGQSTFMVEMSEANHALENATEHSLILFDEIGRGTSTYDGMALAQSMIEYIAAVIHAKTLFSTHYHELTMLADNIPAIRNVHVVVKEDNEKVTFMYKVKDGSADRSYGINVARLAGLPEGVIDRAGQLQKELESKKRVVQQNFQLVEMKRENPAAEKVLGMLKEVNVDDLSPRQAWQMLADLSEESRKE
ncbi:MAG: DNA mismatch repair protein MutS [Solobacterium sp.]|nr:DNA mismatch repair protein MutS [Solobacterium sp.]